MVHISLLVSMSVFSCICITIILCAGAESDVTVHARRRQAEAQAWCELRNHIMSVRLEEFCPATRKCSVCGTDAAELVRCKDCGPRGFYCHSCDDRIHSVVFWHQSHVWFEVSLLRRNQLELKVKSMFTLL